MKFNPLLFRLKYNSYTILGNMLLFQDVLATITCTLLHRELLFYGMPKSFNLELMYCLYNSFGVQPIILYA